MFFAMSFEIYIVRKKEIMPEIKIVIKIIFKCVNERFFIISFMAIDVPVLVFPMLYNVIKDNPATIVFIEPSRIRNCFLFFSCVMSEPITAA